MKTKIIKIKGDWQEVVNDCRATVGKPPLGKEPSTAFKKSILISEHSTIRAIIIKWIWEGIPSWVATHFSRHKWECYIQTQRTDRTGVNRDKLPQDAPVNFTGEANPQHLIDTARKRLCMLASRKTRRYMENLKTTLKPVEPRFPMFWFPTVSIVVAVPNPTAVGGMRRWLHYIPIWLVRTSRNGTILTTLCFL